MGKNEHLRIDRTGEVRIMNNGLKATITTYRTTRDIDIEFENGILVNNKYYRHFNTGSVDLPRKNRIGETRTMKSGLTATIIRYGSTRDIDVQFDCGGIALNKPYAAFKAGEVKSPMVVEYFEDYCKITNPNTTRKTEFLIDTEDLEKVLNVGFWSVDKKGYVVNVNNSLKLHRFVLDITDENQLIDHESTDKTDCRKHNLRLCVNAENRCNMGARKHNTSGYKGVSWHIGHKKWGSQIGHNGKRISLGYYDTKEEAAKAYNKAAIKYHGEFARLNVI